MYDFFNDFKHALENELFEIYSINYKIYNCYSSNKYYLNSNTNPHFYYLS